jgi:hypothetical protein
VSENTVVKEMFGTNEDELSTLGQYTKKNFSVYTGHIALLEW